MSLFSFLAVETGRDCRGQTLPLGNPITASIPLTSYSLELENVIQIPNSGSNQAPRLEQLETSGDGSGRLFVADQRGKIFSFMPGDSSPTEFFDVSDHVPNFLEAGNQKGVRSFAFHPQAFSPGAPGHGKFYTAESLKVGSNNYFSTVSEWTLDASGSVNLTAGRREVLRATVNNIGHNIGQIGFNRHAQSNDSDFGKLFIALGDGGNLRRPENGQDLTTLLGSILRIDPLASGSQDYVIPSDNPFVGDGGGVREEIWAYGLRNPHKFSWDLAGSHKMLISDIGQANIEEINLGALGANYGWLEREGSFVNNNANNPISSNRVSVLPANHVSDEYTYPVAQFDRVPTAGGTFVSGSAAVVGGYVFRSALVPELQGKYLFANFAKTDGPIYVVDVDTLVQREDFSNLTSLDNGFLAPIEELQLMSNGQSVSMLDIIQAASDNSSLNRTDIRFGYGDDGQVYVMNKHDGTIRRFTATADPGDFDGDGDIDGADFLRWQRNDGSASGLANWATNFGDPVGTATNSSTVPEPTTGQLALLTYLGGRLGLRRKSRGKSGYDRKQG